jgi:myo-inositol-1(or 4)-monophosphatase
MMNAKDLEQCMTSMVREAGDVLKRHFGRIRTVRQKESPYSVVCEADLAAEACVLARLKSWFPHDNLISEEAGFRQGTSGRTWILDPLDGTSNFLAGLPWFGVQIALLQGRKPLAAAMYLPAAEALYFAAAGAGVRKNGRRIHTTRTKDLSTVLCGFGFDPGGSTRSTRGQVELLRRVGSGVRNIRATNSLVDFCYTLEGQFGCFVNLNTKIWDIAPVCLMMPEAGGRVTDLSGRALVFDLDPRTCGRSYEVAGAPRALHAGLVRLLGCARETARGRARSSAAGGR